MEEKFACIKNAPHSIRQVKLTTYWNDGHRDGVVLQVPWTTRCLCQVHRTWLSLKWLVGYGLTLFPLLYNIVVRWLLPKIGTKTRTREQGKTEDSSCSSSVLSGRRTSVHATYIDIHLSGTRKTKKWLCIYFQEMRWLIASSPSSSSSIPTLLPTEHVGWVDQKQPTPFFKLWPIVGTNSEREKRILFMKISRQAIMCM